MGAYTKTTTTQALQFAIDQAPFACEAAASSHTPAADGNLVRGKSGGAVDSGSSAVEATATTDVPDTAGIRLAVRAGLQFACNYCAGSEQNKALVWDAWFPRGLMVRFSPVRLDDG